MVVVSAAMWLAVAAPMSVAQTSAPATQAPATATPTKAYTFEVVSIRQNKSPMQGGMGMPQFGPPADGYRMSNMSLSLPIMTAYAPQVGGAAFYAQDQVKGLPDWLNTERYDIDARIADEDRAEWQKPESQKVMLQAMLQAMFVERCKLAVHREVKEVGVSSLVVAKGGVKFKETDPTVEHPEGMKLPWGGVLAPNKGGDGLSFFGTSMASFASILSSMANGGKPIQDKTGLKGNYDITMKMGAMMGPSGGDQQSATAASDPGGSMIAPVLNDLGLKLDSEKGQVETLVIDHIERPTEN
jgi:uncharacterized protein (TIGR03435 family)